MPNLKQHSKRIRLSLAWFDCVKTADPKIFVNPLTNEYFYCALHMFEAAAVAFPNSFSKPHFFSHVERNVELGKIKLAPLHPLNSMASAYETLSDLSRRSRYLQITERHNVLPIKTEDVTAAQESFAQVKIAVESFFTKMHADKAAPWMAKEDSLG